MNRIKLIPLTALLVVPLFMSCNSKPVSEVMFNNNCSVFTYGTSICNVEISKESSDAKFKKEISSRDVAMSNDGKLEGKKLDAVKYIDEQHIQLVFSGTLTKDYKESGKTQLEIKESAFVNKTLGGKLIISLFLNRYDVEGGGPTPGTYHLKLDSIGGDFSDEIIKTGKSNFEDNKAFGGTITTENKKIKSIEITKAQEKGTIGNMYNVDITMSSEIINDGEVVIKLVNGATVVDDENAYCDINFDRTVDAPIYFSHK